MKLHTFKMERWLCTLENKAEYDLSESGVRPFPLSELLDGDSAQFLEQSLGYPQSKGSEELRRKIAALYGGADQDNVLVTNGSSEGIFHSTWPFLERGAEIVVMLPNYLQTWGLGKTFQAKLKSFRVRELEGEWKPDLSALTTPR
jgi:aspartate/methionine/tyrosine aminotransferase